MTKFQQSWVLIPASSDTAWNLKGDKWNSVDHNTVEIPRKIPQKPLSCSDFWIVFYELQFLCNKVNCVSMNMLEHTCKGE